MFADYYLEIRQQTVDGLQNPANADEATRLVVSYPHSFNEVWSRGVEAREKHWQQRLFLMPPLYISNGDIARAGCLDHCKYCPWRQGNVPTDQLVRLSPEETQAEARYLIQELGYRNIELVTATDPLLFRGRNVAPYVQAVRKAGAYWTGLNFFPLSQTDYLDLVEEVGESHLFSIVWQETYNQELYINLHEGGPKSNMEYRLNAHDRACQAGIPVVGVAFLGGLSDWRLECLMTLAHARYLKEEYGVQIIFGMPRWKRGQTTSIETCPYPDKAYQFVGALYSLCMPDALVWFSTREDHALSARCASGGGCLFTLDCSTEVGGYTRKGTTLPQFPVHTMDLANGVPWLENLGFSPTLSLPW